MFIEVIERFLFPLISKWNDQINYFRFLIKLYFSHVKLIMWIDHWSKSNKGDITQYNKTQIFKLGRYLKMLSEKWFFLCFANVDRFSCTMIGKTWRKNVSGLTCKSEQFHILWNGARVGRIAWKGIAQQCRAFCKWLLKQSPNNLYA